jgi:hypothetical protein
LSKGDTSPLMEREVGEGFNKIILNSYIAILKQLVLLG